MQVAHLNPFQFVLVGTMREADAFACQVPTGAFADVFSCRLSVIIGTFLIGAGFIIEGVFPALRQPWLPIFARTARGTGQ